LKLGVSYDILCIRRVAVMAYIVSDTVDKCRGCGVKMDADRSMEGCNYCEECELVLIEDMTGEWDVEFTPDEEDQ
jgi:hypothetical protein